MNYEFFKLKVSQTPTFDDYLKLISTEVKKFVQDIDLKNYGQCKEVLHTFPDALVELKNSDSLQWDQDSTGRKLFMVESTALNKKILSHDARESLAIVIDKEFQNEYTLVNNLSKEEIKQLELNFRSIVIMVVTNMYDIAPQQEQAEMKKDLLLTDKLFQQVDKNTNNNTMKMG